MEHAVSDACQIILCPCSDRREAQRIAEALVEQELAAAVNVIAQDSVYRWQGRVNQAAEFLLLIKSQQENYDAIERIILDMHSYELPGIAVIPVVNGYAPYLTWIRSSGAT